MKQFFYLPIGIAVIFIWAEIPGFAEALGASSTNPPSRPNIIFILCDDLGYGDLSCYRQDPSPAYIDSPMLTPHLDSLAAEGVKFTYAYAPQMCSPSRASLMTGKYSQRFGYYTNTDAEVGVPKTEVTIGELLSPTGYATACLGKWHLGILPGGRPLDRGFQRFYGFLGAAHNYFQPSVGTDLDGPLKEGSYVWDQDKPVTSMKYLTDQLTDEAIDFIDQNQKADKPFFIYLAYNAPHGPTQPKPDKEAEFARFPVVKNPPRTKVRAVVDSVDEDVGRIQREIFLRGLDRNTLFILASDNGGNEYERPDGIRTVQHNGGLRGRKYTVYEGGLRVPLIMRWTDHLPKGEIISTPVNLFDTYATIAAAAQVPIPASQKVDAVNLLPYMTGEKSGPVHDAFYATAEPGAPIWSVRMGDWKLLMDKDSLMVGPNGKDSPQLFGLFDLSKDFNERHNVIDQFPEIRAKLQKAHDDFIESCPPSLARSSRTKVGPQGD